MLYQKSIVLSVLVVGVVVTIAGFSQMTALKVYPDIEAIIKYALVLVVFSVVLEKLAKVFNISILAIGMFSAFLIAVITNTTWPLLVTMWFGLASILVGQSVITVLNKGKYKASASLSLLTGAAVYGTTIGILVHFPVNYAATYSVLLLVPLVAGRNSITLMLHRLRSVDYNIGSYKWLDISIVLISLIHFTVALMPEVGHDALAMHLFIPGHIAYRHEWGFDVDTYVWAVMPMLGDWIYALVYMLGGETAARLVNVGFIFVLCLLLRKLVLWAGGNERGARWAILIFLTTPLVFTESSSLFIESIWTTFVIAGTFVILKLIYSDDEGEAQLALAGLLLGSALAAKAVTFTLLPALLIVLVFGYRKWLRHELVNDILLGLVLFIAVGAIPYFTAWYLTGNPVFPFFNEYFQAPQYPPENFSAVAFFEKGASWDTIYRITFDSGRYLESRPGAGGFQWLLLLLPAVVLFLVTWDRRKLALIFIGTMMVVITFHHTAYLRYVLPSYLVLGAVIGVFLSSVLSYGNKLLNRTVLVVAISAILLNLLFFKSGTYAGDISRNALKSEEGRKQYLENRLPIRNAVSLVNHLNAGGAPVAVFAQPLTAGLNSDALYPNWYNHTFQSRVNSADSAESLSELLMAEGVDYVILDESWGVTNKQLIVKEATQLVSNIGSVSVRKLRYEYRFNTELLQNTAFSTDDHWQLVNEARLKPDGILVSVNSPAFQVVPISESRSYLLTVQAYCVNETTKGRMQVNWMDEKSNLIKTNIKVFSCTEAPSSKSMEVIAPRNAINAVVYATGHKKDYLVINSVSFKQ